MSKEMPPEVAEFDKELHNLFDSRAVSASKIDKLTKLAFKAAKYYKNIVYCMEKFITRCVPEYKLTGLYVLDSICRTSQSVKTKSTSSSFTGSEYVARFEKNIEALFSEFTKVQEDKEKEKVKRVVVLWERTGTFAPSITENIRKKYFPLLETGSDKTEKSTTKEAKKNDVTTTEHVTADKAGESGQVSDPTSLITTLAASLQAQQASGSSVPSSSVESTSASTSTGTVAYGAPYDWSKLAPPAGPVSAAATSSSLLAGISDPSSALALQTILATALQVQSVTTGSGGVMAPTQTPSHPHPHPHPHPAQASGQSVVPNAYQMPSFQSSDVHGLPPVLQQLQGMLSSSQKEAPVANNNNLVPSANASAYMYGGAFPPSTTASVSPSTSTTQPSAVAAGMGMGLPAPGSLYGIAPGFLPSMGVAQRDPRSDPRLRGKTNELNGGSSVSSSSAAATAATTASSTSTSLSPFVHAFPGQSGSSPQSVTGTTAATTAPTTTTTPTSTTANTTTTVGTGAGLDNQALAQLSFLLKPPAQSQLQSQPPLPPHPFGLPNPHSQPLGPPYGLSPFHHAIPGHGSMHGQPPPQQQQQQQQEQSQGFGLMDSSMSRSDQSMSGMGMNMHPARLGLLQAGTAGHLFEGAGRGRGKQDHKNSGVSQQRHPLPNRLHNKGDALSSQQPRPPPYQRHPLPPNPNLTRPKGLIEVREDDQVGPDYIRGKFDALTLWVGGGFIPTISEKELETIFSAKGQIATLMVNQSKFNAFIKMADRGQAERCKAELDRTTVQGEVMKVGWGCGFGPRDCFDYTTGTSLIPLERLTDTDRRWLSTSVVGGFGTQEMIRGGVVIYEPNIEPVDDHGRESLPRKSKGFGGGGGGGGGFGHHGTNNGIGGGGRGRGRGGMEGARGGMEGARGGGHHHPLPEMPSFRGRGGGYVGGGALTGKRDYEYESDSRQEQGLGGHDDQSHSHNQSQSQNQSQNQNENQTAQAPKKTRWG
ncbi:hypothetical protein BGZ94_004457 [Podila epigama]|nr:hypothetical protein BGZ94_004457 [Podila epigama]